ncbi:aminotransferase class I/II-fold pyridoxal phosphate-dependent enzyme [Parapedobacter koreensis]|uniref:Glycine C-acetyltransferase n=1 Tax=Parapedobacter koreensis TaxID=332977 RepID=A0A1H7ISM9_9SPHI|nr:aminotransferase class I/II-fold pyridoxal phosphate-dependent enzyme [Parapedobacter koreensis]SEK65408.1 glycine C-acetyltransferase [Parapedobacter koreensis]
MIDFNQATFKDFENIPRMDIRQRSAIFCQFLEFMEENGHMNYRLLNETGCAPEMKTRLTGSDNGETYISLVSNDYLGFTQHPKVKQAAKDGIEKYGTGAGASPLIGGHFEYHELLEKKIAAFFRKPADHSVIFTTGYTANSASLLCLLQKEDLAIIDMAVHASVHEGCILTNKKTFPHNNLESLEHILKISKDKYRTKMVITDGVFSQDGDVAPIADILYLTRKYGAYLMVDDAHGVGVIGQTGRGVLERTGLLDQVDFLTGTFSKTFASIGGYVIANPDDIKFLKFQSRQQIFSATSAPSALGIVKAIELIDEEPKWKDDLNKNMDYLKKGLTKLGLNVGTTESAIIPVKIGDPHKTGDAGRMLLERGINANPILYPAVAKKDARIRMSLSATHTKEQLDKVLDAFDYISKKLNLV